MLLGPDDPPPYTLYAEAGRSRYVLLGDHGGQRIPHALHALGLPQHELDRHIGWDIGIAAVARELSQRLDAFAIVQTYSRLVIDCNRPLSAATSIARVSDGTEIPGNQNLSAADANARAEAIFTPYHQRIAAELDARPRCIVASLHSFTPVMNGFARPWHAGVLYHRDPSFSLALKAALEREPGMVVGDNEPYAVSDATDYAIPVHAERRGLPHVELEIRQDLITHEAGQREWADRLARLFTELERSF